MWSLIYWKLTFGMCHFELTIFKILFFKTEATASLWLKDNLLNAWYSSLNPLYALVKSDSKCKKTWWLDEMKLGGVDCPQYLPIIGAVFEFPSYKVNESHLEYEMYYRRSSNSTKLICTIWRITMVDFLSLLLQPLLKSRSINTT